jgi:hypothetical protein
LNRRRHEYSIAIPRTKCAGSEGENLPFGEIFSFQAVTEDGDSLKRNCGALPRTPPKKIFEKSFFRIFKNFPATFFKKPDVSIEIKLNM